MALPSTQLPQTGWKIPTGEPNRPPPTNRPPIGQSAGSPSWLTPEIIAAGIGTGGNLLGGYLQGRGQQQTTAQSLEAQMQQLLQQQLLQRELAKMEERQRQREIALQTQQQAPERQDWRQRQAILAALLPQMRNVNITPPGDLGRFTPQVSGGMRLPEGGFDPATLAFFSSGARASSEADLDRAGALAAGGNYTVPDYAKAGYGSAAGSNMADVTNYAAQLRQQLAQQQIQQQALDRAGATAGQSRTEQQRQQPPPPREQKPTGRSTGQRLTSAALGAGMGYLGTRFGGGGGNPWVSAGLGAFGGFFS